MDLQQVGKFLILFAVVLALLGGVLLFLGRIGMGSRLGSLPGDIHLTGSSWSCFVPITTSIVLSILLTVILSIVLRFFR